VGARTQLIRWFLMLCALLAWVACAKGRYSGQADLTNSCDPLYRVADTGEGACRSVSPAERHAPSAAAEELSRVDREIQGIVQRLSPATR
jgi:hypothetical protein